MRPFAKPNENSPGSSVDLAHLANLVASLLWVVLVDADRINPQHSVLVREAQAPEGAEEVIGDAKPLPLDINSVDDLEGTPGVRQGLIRYHTLTVIHPSEVYEP